MIPNFHLQCKSHCNHSVFLFGYSFRLFSASAHSNMHRRDRELSIVRRSHENIHGIRQCIIFNTNKLFAKRKIVCYFLRVCFHLVTFRFHITTRKEVEYIHLILVNIVTYRFLLTNVGHICRGVIGLTTFTKPVLVRL